MNTVDEIKSKCNIVDVIGRQITLKKVGNNHKGLCPFHNEKTPSFIVSEDKQIFTCFGCGARGDVIEFTQRYHNLDFQGAIEKLAEENGIELLNARYFTNKGNAKYYEINREAAKFLYRAYLKKPNPADEYMTKRGFDPKIMQKFGIGYADGEWQSLYNHLMGKGYDEASLLSLGLISSSGGRSFDKYRKRIIFPIINTRKKIIGFGGRAIDDSTPKYLNSKESSVFQKKNNLFGLYLTRQDINREDCAILVEGYMDLIALYQGGIRNVAACLGTALTENQASMLKRYTDNVVLAYDADEAGQAAALRGMDVLHKLGCRVKVLEIPEGMDPDDYIKDKGRQGFLELLGQALPFMDYKLMRIRQGLDLSTTEGTLAFLKEAALALKKLSPIEAGAYIRKIAQDTGVSEGALSLEVFGENYRAQTESRKATKVGKKNTVTCTMLEQNLINLMMVNSSYVPLIEPYKESFTTAACYRIYEMIRTLYRSDCEIDLQQLRDSLDEEAGKILEHTMESILFADRESIVFEECVAHIKMAEKIKREDELIKILSVLDDEKDKDKILELSMELMKIQKERYGGTQDEL